VPTRTRAWLSSFVPIRHLFELGIHQRGPERLYAHQLQVGLVACLLALPTFAVRDKGIAALIRGRSLEQVPLRVRGVVDFDEPPQRRNVLLLVTCEDGDVLTVFVKDVALEQLSQKISGAIFDFRLAVLKEFKLSGYRPRFRYSK